MSMNYKGAHYDGLDGKNGDDEAGITRLLFLVSFSLNLMKIIPEREKFFWGSIIPRQIWSDCLTGIYSNKIKTFCYFLSTLHFVQCWEPYLLFSRKKLNNFSFISIL